MQLKEAEKTFSVDAVAEINGLKELLNSLYEKTESAYKNCDRKMLKRAYEIEERVDAVTAEMGESHIKRLSDGVCTPEVGAQYLALSINMERIADHYINVAKTIKAYS